MIPRFAASLLRRCGVAGRRCGGLFDPRGAELEFGNFADRVERRVGQQIGGGGGGSQIYWTTAGESSHHTFNGGAGGAGG